MDTCVTCDYYEAMNGKGYCKVEHPHLSPTQSGTEGLFPVVTGADKACGEFSSGA